MRAEPASQVLASRLVERDVPGGGRAPAQRPAGRVGHNGRMSKDSQWIAGINAVASAIEHDADNVREVLLEAGAKNPRIRSEEHTSELQSLMRISYAVFCLKQTRNRKTH